MTFTEFLLEHNKHLHNVVFALMNKYIEELDNSVFLYMATNGTGTLPQPPEPISLEYIEKMVCNAFDVTPETIKGTSRIRNDAMARHTFCYLAFKYKHGKKQVYTLQEIGDYINKGHATVLNGIKSISNYLDTNDRNYLKIFNSIKL